MDAVELMEPPNKINVVHERSVIICSVTAKVLFPEYGLRHRQTCLRRFTTNEGNHKRLTCGGHIARG